MPLGSARRRFTLISLPLFLVSVVSCVPLFSQNVTFSGTQTTVGSGLSLPQGIARDQSDNIYIADTANQRVLKETPAGVQTVMPFTGLIQPVDVAVDAAGDMYVVDTVLKQVVELSAGGTQSYLLTGLTSPVGVAIDGSNNIYVADNSTNGVVKIAAVNGLPIGIPFIGLSQVTGVAVSGGGDVYVTQANNSQIMVCQNGCPIGSVLPVTGLVQPVGMSIDSLGDLYITDSGTGQLLKTSIYGGTPVVAIAGLSSPGHVTTNSVGDLFVADTNDNRALDVQVASVSFTSANVCPTGVPGPPPCSVALTLNYTVAAFTSFGVPSVVTSGAPNLDFTLGSTTCIGNIGGGNTCTAAVTFAPTAPGKRLGAIQIVDPSGTVLATTLLQGVGAGPAMVFNNGALTDVPALGLSDVIGVTVDGKGDIFIADSGMPAVVELPAGGGPLVTVLDKTTAPNLQLPKSLAVDGVGNLYVADYYSGVYLVPVGGGAATILSSGIVSPAGVAVDGAGNVFVAAAGVGGQGEVWKLRPDGSRLLLTIGQIQPTGIAIDSAGNVIYSDLASGRVVELPASGAPAITLASGSLFPFAIALDAADDIYIANGFADNTVMVPAGGGTPVTLNSYGTPAGIALDSAGNIYVATGGASVLVEQQRTELPELSFAATAVGTASADSPQSFTVQNIGNQALNAISPGFTIGSKSFQQVAGAGTPADCTSTFSLSPGGRCNVSISFIPLVSGSIVSSESFTDNNLNAPSAIQTGSLQGATGVGATTITITAPAITYGVNGGVQVTVTSPAGTVTGSVSLTVDGAAPFTLPLNSGSAVFPIFNPAAGAHALSASFAAQNNFTASNAGGTLQVNQAQPTVTFTGAPATASLGDSFIVTATTNGSTTATIAASGPCSISKGGITITGSTGTCMVTASWAQDTNYLAATLTQTTIVGGGGAKPPAVTFTGAPATAAYLSTFVVSSTTSASTTPVITAGGACSILGNSVTMTSGTGTCSLIANWASDANYSAASATQSTSATKIAPTVTFTGAPATAADGASFNVATTTTASTAAIFGAGGACSIVGNSVTMTASSGTCLMTATWAADNNYTAATATQSTSVASSLPQVTITWATPAAINYGTALSATQLDAAATYNGAKVAGTFTYSPAKGAVLGAEVQTLSVVFVPTNQKLNSTTSASVPLQVNQAAPKVTWNKPAAIVYGTMLDGTQLDATASVTGSFVYSPAAGTLLQVGTQALGVTFYPADSTDYTTATSSLNISVTKATPAISWTAPSPISYGTALSNAQLNATSPVAGTFTYSPAAGAVLAQGAHTLSVTFAPLDTTDYATAKASVSLQVNLSAPTISWATPAAIAYGTALGGTQLNATATYNGATVAGTFNYTPAKGTILSAGAQTLTVVFTPSNTSNYGPVSGSVQLQVNQATPKVTWAKPAAITHGTALSATQLDAASSIPGTFLYSPAAGSVLATGTQTLSVTFTPIDSVDYTTQTANTTLTVKP